MYIFKNICFVCLTDSDKNLKSVLCKETEDELFTSIKYALPELEISGSEIPVYICSSCSVIFSNFSTFKKKCLENFSRWKKHYTQILQDTTHTQEQSLNELQIKKDDIQLLIKQEPNLQIVSNIKYKNEIVVEGLAAEQEELFTIKLNIKDENEDVFQSSEDQNHQKTVIKANIEEESLASEECAVQEMNQQPEFVNVKCESVSDEEQDGGGSVTNADNNAVDMGVTITIKDTNRQDLKCIMCNELYSDKSAFDIHLRNHINNIKGLECLICKKQFPFYCYLKQHMKSHFGIKDFECSFCSKMYLNKSSLETHLQTHTGKKKFACTVCNRKFAEKSYLRSHMKFHSGKNYECILCKKKFETSSCLKLHLNCHHPGFRMYECPVCKIKFMQSNILKKHVMKYHKNTQRDQELRPVT